MGFRLEPSCYIFDDWAWLLLKFDKKLKSWSFHCLSLGGRFTLIQLVLQHMDGWAISRPKSIDGWGILDTQFFGVSLLLKSLCSALFGGGIWGQIITTKYLKKQHITYWFAIQEIGIKQGSQIWSSFQKIKSWLFHRVKWTFDRGTTLLSVDTINTL